MTATFSNTNFPAAKGYGPGVVDAQFELAGLDVALSHAHLPDAASANSYEDLLQRLAPIAATTTARLVVVCTGTLGDGNSAASLQLVTGTADAIHDVQHQAIANLARQTTAGPKIQIRRISSDGPDCLVALAVPGQAGQCLVAWFEQRTAVLQTSILTLQAIAAQIGAWRTAQNSATTEAAAGRLAALVELLGRIETAQTPREACRLLAEELQNYLGCQQVVIGLCPPGSSTCRVEAISRVDAFLPRPRCKKRSRGVTCRDGLHPMRGAGLD
jgi:hypothetical protein